MLFQPKPTLLFAPKLLGFEFSVALITHCWVWIINETVGIKWVWDVSTPLNPVSTLQWRSALKTGS